MPASEPIPLRALLARQRPFHETSAILSWIVERYGPLDTVARGIRRPRRGAPTPPRIFLAYTIRVRFARHSTLHTLLDAEPDPDGPEPVRPRVADLEQASRFVEWIRLNTVPGDPSPYPYRLLTAALSDLARSGPSSAQLLSFLLKLLRVHGTMPALNECTRCRRPLADDQATRLDPAADGVLCTTCSAARSLLPELTPPLRQALQLLAWTPFHALPATLRNAPCDELHGLFQSFARAHHLMPPR